jgi:uncharacterized protein YciI
MKQLFAAIRKRGPRFQAGLSLEAQEQWREHADFMNTMQADGFVVLAGPLEGTDEVLLVFRAESAEEVRKRLDEDPWTQLGLLGDTRIAPWTLRMGSLKS